MTPATAVFEAYLFIRTFLVFFFSWVAFSWVVRLWLVADDRLFINVAQLFPVRSACTKLTHTGVEHKSVPHDPRLHPADSWG